MSRICCSFVQSSVKFSISLMILRTFSSLAENCEVLKFRENRQLTPNMNFLFAYLWWCPNLQSWFSWVVCIYLYLRLMQRSWGKFCRQKRPPTWVIKFNLELYFRRKKTHMLGFLMVPLRRLILVMTSKSLNKKKPRSFRPPWPWGIETKSNDKNCLSFDTKSDTPSITPWNSINQLLVPFNFAFFCSTIWTI